MSGCYGRKSARESVEEMLAGVVEGVIVQARGGMMKWDACCSETRLNLSAWREPYFVGLKLSPHNWTALLASTSMLTCVIGFHHEISFTKFDIFRED
jgi:hypothetical protein